MSKPINVGAIDEELARTSRDIRKVVENLADLLIRKNKAYGDSALNPVRIFSSAPADEQIKVRLDDKLNRIRNATLRGEKKDAFDEDVIKDLMGYLVLLRVWQERQPIANTCNSAAPEKPKVTDFLTKVGAENINEFIQSLMDSERKHTELIGKLQTELREARGLTEGPEH